LAIERLLDDCPHPRREPHHGLDIRDWTVPTDFRQRLRVGDSQALEQQVPRLFLDEGGGTVVSVGAGAWVDGKEE
jgi:hypothetical protein